MENTGMEPLNSVKKNEENALIRDIIINGIMEGGGAPFGEFAEEIAEALGVDPEKIRALDASLLKDAAEKVAKKVAEAA